jgi:hypothetical protein
MAPFFLIPTGNDQKSIGETRQDLLPGEESSCPTTGALFQTEGIPPELARYIPEGKTAKMMAAWTTEAVLRGDGRSPRMIWSSNGFGHRIHNPGYGYSVSAVKHMNMAQNTTAVKNSPYISTTRSLELAIDSGKKTLTGKGAKSFWVYLMVVSGIDFQKVPKVKDLYDYLYMGGVDRGTDLANEMHSQVDQGKFDLSPFGLKGHFNDEFKARNAIYDWENDYGKRFHDYRWYNQAEIAAFWAIDCSQIHAFRSARTKWRPLYVRAAKGNGHPYMEYGVPTSSLSLAMKMYQIKPVALAIEPAGVDQNSQLILGVGFHAVRKVLGANIPSSNMPPMYTVGVDKIYYHLHHKWQEFYRNGFVRLNGNESETLARVSDPQELDIHRPLRTGVKLLYEKSMEMVDPQSVQ